MTGLKALERLVFIKSFILKKSVVFDLNTTALEKSMVFDSNTTDFEKSVVFGSNTTDFCLIPHILSGGFGWRVVL